MPKPDGKGKPDKDKGKDEGTDTVTPGPALDPINNVFDVGSFVGASWAPGLRLLVYELTGANAKLAYYNAKSGSIETIELPLSVIK